MSPMSTDFAAQRTNMVESQLRPNQITDESVLTAMEELPREIFVPTALADVSYIDEDLSIAPGRSMLEPMVQARLVQSAGIKPGEKILEIGCGTGYGTALLAKLGAKVTAIDIDSALLAAAAVNLRRLNLSAELVAAPLERGLPEHGPYDVIIVSGAVATVPETWTKQLAAEGRLLVIVRADNGVAQNGNALLFLKTAGVVVGHTLFAAQTPYLPGLAPLTRFTF